MGQDIQEWIKSNLWKATCKKFEVIWSVLTQGCLPQIFLGPLLNTLIHMPVDILYGSREYQKRSRVPREHLRWRTFQEQSTTFSR